MNKYIHTIEERSRKPGTISINLKWLTRTLLHRIAHKSTRTRIHSADKHKSRRVDTTTLNTIHTNHSVFQRLTKSFEYSLRKLEHFVEKKDSFMSQRDFSWFGITTSPNNRDSRSSMMQSTKWPFGNQWMFFSEFPSNRINLTHFDYFLIDHGWKNSSERFREHCLSRSWRSFHEDIVPTSGCDEESAFCILLTNNLREIHEFVRIM